MRTTILKTLAAGVLALAVSFGLAAPSHAAPITFAYEGTVNFTFGGPAFDAFLGQTLRIEYTFESTTADSTAATNRGDYAAITSMTATVGTYSATAAAGPIVVFDNLNGNDEYGVLGISAVGPPIGGMPLNFLQIQLQDPTQTAFANDALPTVQPDPANFGGNNFLAINFFGGRKNSGNIGTDLVTISPVTAPVPEPGTLAMFGLGLAGLGYMRRRRTA